MAKLSDKAKNLMHEILDDEIECIEQDEKHYGGWSKADKKNQLKLIEEIRSALM